MEVVANREKEMASIKNQPLEFGDPKKEESFIHKV